MLLNRCRKVVMKSRCLLVRPTVSSAASLNGLFFVPIIDKNIDRNMGDSMSPAIVKLSGSLLPLADLSLPNRNIASKLYEPSCPNCQDNAIGYDFYDTIGSDIIVQFIAAPVSQLQICAVSSSTEERCVFLIVLLDCTQVAHVWTCQIANTKKSGEKDLQLRAFGCFSLLDCPSSLSDSIELELGFWSASVRSLALFHHSRTATCQKMSVSRVLTPNRLVTRHIELPVPADAQWKFIVPRTVSAPRQLIALADDQGHLWTGYFCNCHPNVFEFIQIEQTQSKRANKEIAELKFSDSAALLVSATRGLVTIYDPLTAQTLSTFPYEPCVTSECSLPTKLLVSSASAQLYIAVFYATTMNVWAPFSPAAAKNIYTLPVGHQPEAFYGDSRKFLVTSDQNDGKTLLWRISKQYDNADSRVLPLSHLCRRILRQFLSSNDVKTMTSLNKSLKSFLLYNDLTTRFH